MTDCEACDCCPGYPELNGLCGDCANANPPGTTCCGIELFERWERAEEYRLRQRERIRGRKLEER